MHPQTIAREAAGALARGYICCDFEADADELAAVEGVMLRLLDDPSPLVRRALADAARLQWRMIERVLTACEGADVGEIAPLVTLLRRFATEAAREEARLFCEELVETPAEIPAEITYSAAA